MLQIAICDDEPIFLNKIRRILSVYLEQKGIDYNIGCYESGKQLIEMAKSNVEYSIIFLDVSMDEMDGLETARIIRTISDKVYIVFITAFITYAMEGYKVNAIRFLLKEDSNLENSIKECIDVVLDKLLYNESWIEIPFHQGKMTLSIDRILYVESRLHKLIFFVLNEGVKEYYIYEKLDKIQMLLQERGFYRVHQSYLVNMKYVRTIERYKIVLNEGTQISISKRYYKNTEREYMRLKGEI